MVSRSFLLPIHQAGTGISGCEIPLSAKNWGGGRQNVEVDLERAAFKLKDVMD